MNGTYVWIIIGFGVVAVVFSQNGDKPGRCPPASWRTAIFCQRRCNTDSSCINDFKCCRTACGGLMCTKPLPPPPNFTLPPPPPTTRLPEVLDTPVTTTTVKPWTERAAVMTSAPSTTTKVPMVIQTTPTRVLVTTRPSITSPPRRFQPSTLRPGMIKTGACSPATVLRVCNVTCHDDSSCEGPLKCCPTSCGGATCSLPVTAFTRPDITNRGGNCPARAEHPGPWVCNNSCDLDIDCHPSSRCCVNRCGARTCTLISGSSPRN